VPEHIRAAAREMNRKAFEERLREIKMSPYDAELYDRYSSQVGSIVIHGSFKIIWILVDQEQSHLMPDPITYFI